MNNTAKLVRALVQCSGITDARKLAEMSGVPAATIYRALKDIRLNILVCENIPVGENENIPVGENETRSPSRARKLYEENNNTPIVPKTDEPEQPKRRKAARKLADMDGFEEFWDVYPKKVGKGAAEKAWPKAVQRAGSAQTILDGLKLQLPTMKAKERQFVKHPSTWLNQVCWEDEPERPNGHAPSELDFFLRQSRPDTRHLAIEGNYN